MRRQQNTSGFNKEKLVFLGGSLTFSLGLFLFLSSSPVDLEIGKPLGTQTGPLALANVNAARPLEENFYVMPGSASHMIDPRTAQLVNRDRKTPFAPKSDFNKKNLPPPAVANVAPPPPPPPPPPGPSEKITDTGKKKKEFGAADREAEVQYMGVVMINGQSYGLLKPRDGSSPKRVQVGDKIPDYDYTVTKIDKNAVSLVDKDNRPYLLKDNRFSDDLAMSDSTNKAAGDEDAPVKTPKDKTDKKTPPDKAPDKTPAKTTKAPDKPAADKPVDTKKDVVADPGLDPAKLKKLEELLKRREGLRKPKAKG